MKLQLPMQSMHITTNVVSSNPAQGDVYSVQHYVIKFVSDLRQVCCFLRVLLSATLKYFSLSQDVMKDSVWLATHYIVIPI
jgi:hypothetical protein